MADMDTSGAAPKGRTKACTACRQVKLKCNARDVYPSPCARCVAQRLECRMDPTFKRVPARKQLEEVTNRLMKLQRSLGLGEDFAALEASGSGGGGGGGGGSGGGDGGSGSAAGGTAGGAAAGGAGAATAGGGGGIGAGAGSATSDPGAHRSSSATASGALPQSRLLESSVTPGRQESSSRYAASDSEGMSPSESRFLDLIDEPAEGQWELGGVELSYPRVLELFRHFDKALWRHVPFIEPCHSLHRLYHTSDLLFWTIILVSTRLFNEYDSVCQCLIPAHRALLSSSTLGSRVSLETIHSVLLVCTWPYPVQSQMDDKSWLLSGMALNLALSIGLHKPDHSHEYATYDAELRLGAPYVRNMTWLACFKLSTSLASWHGLPPSISSTVHLETIDRLCQDARYPRNFCAKVEIQRQVSRIINGLDARLDFRTRYSLIKLYEQDLDRVQSMFATWWSEELEVDWLSAKLFLYGMAFISSENNAENHDRAAGAREMLQYGLATSSRLLSTFFSLNMPPTVPGENRTGCSDYAYQIAFLPKHYFRVAAYASFFLLWYLAVDHHASERDKELATRNIALTYKLLHSLRHSEEHQRAGTSIEMMARFGAISSEHNVEAAYLLVNSRLGASFMFSLKYEEYEVANLQIAQSIAQGADAAATTGAPVGATGAPADAQPSSPATAAAAKLPGAPQSTDSEREPDLTSSTTGTEGPDEFMSPAPQLPLPQKQPEQPQPAQQPSQQQQQQQEPPPIGPARGHAARQSAAGPVEPSNMFSSAFFQGSAPDQNFDFLWQQWDPAVFDDVKMDVDAGPQYDEMSYDDEEHERDREL